MTLQRKTPLRRRSQARRPTADPVERSESGMTPQSLAAFRRRMLEGTGDPERLLEVEPVAKQMPGPTFQQGKARVKRRAKGRCEAMLPGCTGRHEQTHHRKLRRHGDHRPAALLAVCHRCHLRVHTLVGGALRFGYLVRSGDDPATVIPGVDRGIELGLPGAVLYGDHRDRSVHDE